MVAIAALHHETTTRAARLAAYQRAMTEKFSTAAQRPWLLVEPDPPEPN
jgi:hypothetical protein